MAAPQITRTTMLEPLLAADPSFQPRWEAFMAEWSDEPEPPLYLALGPLAEHILGRVGQADTKDLDTVFAVIERWCTEGDAYVSEAAGIGLLEKLQNQLGGNDRRFRRPDGVTAHAVERWLGPQTKRWWDKLNRFWDGDTQLRTISPDLSQDVTPRS